MDRSGSSGLQNGLHECLYLWRVTAFQQTSQPVFGLNDRIGDVDSPETGVWDKFKVRDDPDAQSLLDRLPDALAAAYFEQRLDRNTGLPGGDFEGAARGRTCFTQDEGLAGKFSHGD